MNATDIARIAEIISQEEYAYYAVRVLASPLAVGDSVDASRRWHDGDPINAYAWVDESDVERLIDAGYERMSDDDAEIMRESGYWGDGDALMVNWDDYELLDGSCGIDARGSLGNVSRYTGDHVVVIAGDIADEGNDIDEIVIHDAVVVAVIR